MVQWAQYRARLVWSLVFYRLILQISPTSFSKKIRCELISFLSAKWFAISLNYFRRVFSVLRALEQTIEDEILVETPPTTLSNHYTSLLEKEQKRLHSQLSQWIVRSRSDRMYYAAYTYEIGRADQSHRDDSPWSQKKKRCSLFYKGPSCKSSVRMEVNFT